MKISKILTLLVLATIVLIVGVVLSSIDDSPSNKSIALSEIAMISGPIMAQISDYGERNKTLNGSGTAVTTVRATSFEERGVQIEVASNGVITARAKYKKAGAEKILTIVVSVRRAPS